MRRGGGGERVEREGEQEKGNRRRGEVKAKEQQEKQEEQEEQEKQE